MAKVCNTMDLTFTTQCIGFNTTKCSPILTNPGTLKISNPGDSTRGFQVIFLDKENNFVKNETVWGGDSKSFYTLKDENYNYQLLNIEPNIYSFNYTECHNLTGMQGINSDLSNGSSTFFDTVSVIAPFIAIMIMFALGFNFLKNLISKSSKGRV